MRRNSNKARETSPNSASRKEDKPKDEKKSQEEHAKDDALLRLGFSPKRRRMTKSKDQRDGAPQLTQDSLACSAEEASPPPARKEDLKKKLQKSPAKTPATKVKRPAAKKDKGLQDGQEE